MRIEQRIFGSVARDFLCHYVVSRNIKPRLIFNRTGTSLYLERYYLAGGPSEEGEFADVPLQVCLHRFARSDEDGALHNHPWEMSVSFILAGGYAEQRKVGVEIRTNWLFPGDFNFIAQDDFHRVDLIESDCWTLFISGKKTQSWGFLEGETFTPWREFIARLRGIDPSTINDNIRKTEDVGRELTADDFLSGRGDR